MNRRELIERSSAEIIKAAAEGDHERASELAELQRDVIARILRDSAAHPSESVLAAERQSATAKLARALAADR